MKVFFHLFVLWKVEAMPLFISDSRSSFFPLISQTNAKAATGEPSLLRFTYLILVPGGSKSKMFSNHPTKAVSFPTNSQRRTTKYKGEQTGEQC